MIFEDAGISGDIIGDEVVEGTNCATSERDGGTYEEIGWCCGSVGTMGLVCFCLSFVRGEKDVKVSNALVKLVIESFLCILCSDLDCGLQLLQLCAMWMYYVYQ